MVNFLAILLTCIIGASVFYTYFLPTVHGESNAIIKDEQANSEAPYVELEDEEIEVLEKKRFSSFKQAYTHAFRYLYNSKGYTSVARGSAFANASFIEIQQTLYVYKQVNNRTNEAFVKTYSKKLKTFGTNTALQYYQNNNDVYYHQGWFDGLAFKFPKTYETSTYSQYKTTFGISPVELMVYLTEFMSPINERMQYDGLDYILTFELPFDGIADGFILFLLNQLNSTHVEYDLQKGAIRFELRMDHFGVIKTLYYTSTFNCYFPRLPEIGIPIMSNGGFTMTETFSNVNRLVKVNNITLA